MRRPDFFIVGASRCGTTAMKTHLSDHPEIFMPPTRLEPGFFGTDLKGTGFIRDEREYLSLFELARGEKRVGEKSNMYLYSERAASEIRRFEPRAKIIVMLRNPVEMIRSLHALRVYQSREDITDLACALDAEADRMRGRRVPETLSAEEGWRLCYRDKGRYADQVGRYRDAFGKERVHVVIYDDFREDPLRIYKETLAFLDVDTAFAPEFRRVNASRQARSRIFQRILTNPPAPVRSLVKGIVPILWRQRIADTLDRLSSTEIPHAPLSPDLKRRLQSEFLPEIERLGALLDRDLTHWCRS